MEYKVICCGVSSAELSRQEVVERLISDFSLPSKLANQLVGAPGTVVKRHLTHAKALAYQAKLTRCGLQVMVEEEVATDVLRESCAVSSPESTSQAPPGKRSFVSIIRDFYCETSRLTLAIAAAGLVVLCIAITFIWHAVTTDDQEQLAEKYQHALEQYVSAHGTVPDRLDQLTLEPALIEYAGSGTMKLLDDGELRFFSSADGSQYFTLIPRLSGMNMQWRCEITGGFTGEYPFECMSAQVWASTGKKVASDDKNISVVLPNKTFSFSFSIPDTIDLIYFDGFKDNMIMVISTPKSETEAISYGDFHRQTFDEQLKDDVLLKPYGSYDLIDAAGRHAVIQYARSVLTREFLAVAVVDGKNAFHDITFMGTPRDIDQYMHEVKLIVASFKEGASYPSERYPGRRQYRNGEYVGPMDAGEPAGNGEFQYDNGDVLVGGFSVDGLMPGEVKYTWSASGDYSQHSFEGHYINDIYTGYGTYRWPRGTIQAPIKTGLVDGFGEIKFESGARYDGEFDRGSFDGAGTYYWPDGDYYKGSFAEGLFHGSGNCFFEGSITPCAYEYGSRVR